MYRKQILDTFFNFKRRKNNKIVLFNHILLTRSVITISHSTQKNLVASSKIWEM